MTKSELRAMMLKRAKSCEYDALHTLVVNSRHYDPDWAIMKIAQNIAQAVQAAQAARNIR